MTYTETIETGVEGVIAKLVYDEDCQSPYDTQSQVTVLADLPNLDYFTEWLTNEVLAEAEDLGFAIDTDETYYTVYTPLAEKLIAEAEAVDARETNNEFVLAYLSQRDGETYLYADDGSENLGNVVAATAAGVKECIGEDATQEQIERATESEAKEYRQWCEGECYGVIIETPSGKELDACWGYIGYEYAEENAGYLAKEAAETLLVETLAQFGSAAEAVVA